MTIAKITEFGESVKQFGEDCFVALLLAMTLQVITVLERINTAVNNM
jgi:hypothetical protein